MHDCLYSTSLLGRHLCHAASPSSPPPRTLRPTLSDQERPYLHDPYLHNPYLHALYLHGPDLHSRGCTLEIAWIA